MIIYTDGGCSGNGQKDLTKRKMIAIVTDEHGEVLVEKYQEGGSNNIAELLAVKEALMWCSTHNVKQVEVRTDSRNNLAWVRSRRVGKNVNDPGAVMYLKGAINALKGMIELKLVWVPREDNVAGHYIESKYLL